jgi:hypothetical protein
VLNVNVGTAEMVVRGFISHVCGTEIALTLDVLKCHFQHEDE